MQKRRKRQHQAGNAENATVNGNGREVRVILRTAICKRGGRPIYMRNGCGMQKRQCNGRWQNLRGRQAGKRRRAIFARNGNARRCRQNGRQRHGKRQASGRTQAVADLQVS